jgi:hypothetical protein
MHTEFPTAVLRFTVFINDWFIRKFQQNMKRAEIMLQQHNNAQCQIST